MTVEPSRDGRRVAERWNRVFEVLSAEPRRQLLTTLADAPAGRHVSLPDAAVPPNGSVDHDRIRIHLRHRHLPMLADGGFVEWKRDPFRAWRGPTFDQAAVVLESLYARADVVPDPLVEGCHRLEEERRNDE
ncbi:DUF7344 domain-containing protein [Natrialbaceae archaeon AArc-T1-2]|uniref:DUF7344 domain-containing protein n=1 Tax=Natrialbaceae archaeon AArc-T1-2 TaxID=3053904 RepID=UPI00255B0BFA|nr:hypothetical protein [Natrialbaceae archaeon AArc-T1-2]WIV68320.1 hypothetical protein QQ977_06250 [Natrialbaceae archaeon AArc-T1-2]